MLLKINKTDPYQTHVPVLIEALRHVHGPVLEMGSGEGSTPLLHELGNDLTVTLDHDAAWINKYRSQYDINKHWFLCLNFQEMIMFCEVDDIRWMNGWGLVFIDQGDWQNRWDCLLALKNKARIIILHDSDVYAKRLEGMFKYSRTVMPAEPWPAETGPPTFLASDTIDVTKWEIDTGIEEIET